MANYSANWISTPTLRNEGDSERMDWNAGYWNIPDEILKKLGPPPTPNAKPLIENGQVVGWTDSSNERGGVGGVQWLLDENGNLKSPTTSYEGQNHISGLGKLTRAGALGLIGATAGAAAMGAGGLLSLDPTSWTGLSFGGGGGGAGATPSGLTGGESFTTSFAPDYSNLMLTGAQTAGEAATPEITDAMLAAANATSDPIAALNASAGWTTPDLAYLGSLAKDVGSGAAKTSLAKWISDLTSGAISPSAVAALGGLAGSALGYIDAKKQEGKTQGGAPAVSAVGMQYLNNMKPYERNTQYATQLQGLLGPRQQQANPQLDQAQQYVSGLLGAGYQPFKFY